MTACNIHFTEADTPGTVTANVYLHYDGYPSVVLGALEQFFDHAEKTAKAGNPLEYAEFTAAGFVVWSAAQMAEFAGADAIGISTEDSLGSAFIYTVECQPKGRPKVTYVS